ncbi:MAG: YbaB/EbfC family nucleoid-associated protein [Alphaproteobacteria bacterium]
MKNLGQMLKQAQEMQEKMAEMQARLEEKEISGTAGAGMVCVVLNGKGALKSVTIDPDLLKPEDAGIVQDLLVTAHADAKSKLEQAVQEQMQQLTGGLPLPPGFKMPF